MDPIDIRKRVVNGLLAGYLVFVFAILIYTLVQGVSWLRNPFIGKFLEPSFIITNQPKNGITQSLGLAFENEGELQLVTLQETPILQPADFDSILVNLQPGDKVRIGVRSDRGEIQQTNQNLTSVGLVDQIQYFYLPVLIAWLFFFTALLSYKNWIISQGQTGPVIFNAALAVVMGSAFDVISTHRIYPLWILFVALAGAALLHFATQQFKMTRLYNQLIGLVYFLGIVVAFFSWIKPYGISSPESLENYLQYVTMWGLIAFWISVLLFLITIVTSRSPDQRRRIFISFSAVFVAFVPLQIWVILKLVLPPTQFTWWLLSALIILPLVQLTVGLRGQPGESNATNPRLLLYSLLLLFVTVGFALLVAGIGVIFLGRIQSNNLFLNGFVIFILALLLLPVKSWFDQQINRGKSVLDRNYEGKLSLFNSDLSHLSALDDIVNLLRLDIQGTVQAQIIHIFLWNSSQDSFFATGKGVTASSDISFESGSPLPGFLAKESDCLYFSNIEQLPVGLRSEKERIRLLAARLFIPIHGQNTLLGWVAMSNRLDGETINEMELTYLKALVLQASVAIERSLVIDSLQRRIIELDILTRAAQGVSYTLQLDDIYEFIYNSISQVQTAEYFYILLHETDARILNQVFWVEHGERLGSKENISLLPEKSLEMQVIQSGKARIVDDLQREIQPFFRDQSRSNFQTVLMVPLNTGANTLGVIVFGQESGSLAVSEERISLLQALADQFAAALVKVRLLNESELRGKQLVNLNRLTQQLTSTLSVTPLYKNILQISMEILNCKGGALLIIDPLSLELEYRVCLGEYNKHMEGKRIPSGSGISAKAITTSKTEVVYQFEERVQEPKLSSIKISKMKPIMVVPLISNNGVIGVLELLEHSDGMPFSASDQEIMTAFAAQAAIALENARLYSNTDQALTSRIEELSIMQRIDRELNSTLNLVRALDITLHWAIRQSMANAGIIGQVYPEGIRLEVYEGLETGLLEDLLDKNLDIGFMGVKAAFEQGKPLQKRLASGESRLHPDANLQVIIPITRKEQRLAFFLLEFFHSDYLEEQTIEFLVRLSDHASFALVNSQLYAEVQSASVAKSEFVNLVAHELKNPMTSIKGYTELLAGAAVGPINEAQGNFLGTIRSNIDRMNTLISDLNDLSKIEAGRLRLEFTTVNLAEIIQKVIQANSRWLAEKKQNVTLEIPENLPKLWLDAMRLDQIFTNLLSNAIKYSGEETRICIGAEKESDESSSDGGSQWLHAWVSDEGIGIKGDDQKKIFQKFFRSEDPKSREVAGTGLGLNITRSMVELQGGSIWFESEFRKGTKFHLRLPISREKP